MVRGAALHVHGPFRARPYALNVHNMRVAESRHAREPPILQKT